MNREIKFRAWDTDSKSFLPWSTFINAINPCKEDDWKVISLRYRDNIVLQQSTGLKDKNGKEIYEGDIIRTRTPYRTTQTHHDPYMVEPLEPAIKERLEIVSFNGGCFVLGEPSLGDLLCWQIIPYDKNHAIEAFQSNYWEGEDGDLAYLLDFYKLTTEEELIKYIGAEVIGNVHEHPELIKQ